MILVFIRVHSRILIRVYTNETRPSELKILRFSITR